MQPGASCAKTWVDLNLKPTGGLNPENYILPKNPEVSLSVREFVTQSSLGRPP